MISSARLTPCHCCASAAPSSSTPLAPHAVRPCSTVRFGPMVSAVRPASGARGERREILDADCHACHHRAIAEIEMDEPGQHRERDANRQVAEEGENDDGKDLSGDGKLGAARGAGIGGHWGNCGLNLPRKRDSPTGWLDRSVLRCKQTVQIALSRAWILGRSALSQKGCEQYRDTDMGAMQAPLWVRHFDDDSFRNMDRPH